MIDGMTWVVAPNIKALFGSFNKIAPNRDKASDGTIGDYAHSTGVSGHNPDDTAGTTAERTDADSIAEVRAGDVDSDLRTPGLTMEECVQRIVRTPNLRNRLIYVIYNRRIWSASGGWVAREYTGSNPHDHHAHFSGHPDHDNNSAPWAELEQMGEQDMVSPEEHAAIIDTDRTLDELDGRNALGQAYTRMALGEDHLLRERGVTYVPQHPSLRDLGTKLDTVLNAVTAGNAADAIRDQELRAALDSYSRGEVSAEEFVDAVARRLAGPVPPPTGA